MTTVSRNPVAIVTGGSRGIGRGITLELARAGFDLVINCYSDESAASEAKAEALASRERIEVEICRADVSVRADRSRLLDTAREIFGRLDLLVNNAGIAPRDRVDLLDGTEESFDRVIDVNLKGPYFLSLAAARWMIEQRSALGETYRPAIVNITSISAVAASPDRGDYCVSKAGMAMATKLFAVGLAPHGINVYEVRPGIISTDMTAVVKEKYDALIEDGITPIRRWGTPFDVGRAVSAIAEGLLPFSTGEVINVDGGFHIQRL
jgi:NAD(P)-dependent dehydrogenase (short-subunit alcohol dehydrogenase family)